MYLYISANCPLPSNVLSNIDSSRISNRDYDDLFLLFARELSLYLTAMTVSRSWRTAKELFTIMPRKKNPTKENRVWHGFVNITLNKSDKKEFLQWHASNVENYSELFGGLIETGHKVSYKWDDKSECYLVSVTGETDQCLNQGWCMTSRSPDVLEVLWLALYKHYKVCDGDWAEYTDTSGNNWG